MTAVMFGVFTAQWQAEMATTNTEQYLWSIHVDVNRSANSRSMIKRSPNDNILAAASINIHHRSCYFEGVNML